MRSPAALPARRPASLAPSNEVRQDQTMAYEILPLTDDPEPYTWASPEDAAYYTVYARGDDGLAFAKVDTPSLEAAWAYVEMESNAPAPRASVWMGASFMEIRRPRWKPTEND